ncbi:hypothetical protein [Bacteroides cellulosilyticus]|uniref:hypothetical protein n=1 Tax=Bacteroides cellulosilyticus TaxID=246787 RepID=UPI001C3797B0|nr:hypothetical protein [Bacteroides cellulosilyticus]MBV3636064.1 hypothetical protein [Bacteroides cellulosilyticus]MBV3662743.1 hypothetical protein [Bacteroides cellulosilyticus]MBV3684864.1 hypothetical protein [Bacteroides cellulosilyticus]MBV3693082.1 hypothetical protein [Bacteroides cellulosilyticus]MBV3706569.1 hypothetical protein [Bacteroides cellulosilyticus]
MKMKNLLFVIIALLPMGLMAQPDITLAANYSPYESTILIHVVNNTDKPMRIRNSYGASSGSLIQFRLKDKVGKEISLYDAIFYEGVKYQRFVQINSHSAKTFRFPLKYLCPSNRISSDIYSVDASCFINYSIPEEEKHEFVHKVLAIKTKQDLMIYSGYDSYNQNIMITLRNESDYEMTVYNSSAAVQFIFLNQQGIKLGTKTSSLSYSGNIPSTIKIAPHSSKVLSCSFVNMIKGWLNESDIAAVEMNCKMIYDIPDQKITNKSSQKIYTIKIK